MSSETGIDGRRATTLAQGYFTEQYGTFGVVLFEVESVDYDENEQEWTVKCSFFRTMTAPQKSYYSVVVHSDESIGPVKKIEEPTR